MTVGSRSMKTALGTCFPAPVSAKKVEKESTRREAKKIIAATNNHYKGQAAVNAVDLKRLLGMKDVAVPPELAEAYPQLREIAKRSHR